MFSLKIKFLFYFVLILPVLVGRKIDKWRRGEDKTQFNLKKLRRFKDYEANYTVYNHCPSDLAKLLCTIACNDFPFECVEGYRDCRCLDFYPFDAKGEIILPPGVHYPHIPNLTELSIVPKIKKTRKRTQLEQTDLDLDDDPKGSQYPVVLSKLLLPKKSALRHHIAHFCPDLDEARKCIRKCMKVGKPAFCGKDHVCYCGHRYTSHDEDKSEKNAADIYKDFKDMYQKYFGNNAVLVAGSDEEES